MRFFISEPARAAAFLLLISTAGHAQAGTTNPSSPPRPPAASEQGLEDTTAGCAHPFGLRQGQDLEYQLLDARGKAVGTWRYSVLSISRDSMGKKKPVPTTKIRLKSGFYDLSNRVLQQQDLSYFCRQDTTFTDGLGEINYAGLKSFRDRRLVYQGTPLAWPNQPAVGSRLAPGGAAVQVSSPSVSIAKVTTTLSQRRVLSGPAPVTVPAGTFSCYAVESQREMATAARVDLVLKSGGREVNYYSPAVGIVKTEYFDKNNKLLQTRVLSKR